MATTAWKTPGTLATFADGGSIAWVRRVNEVNSGSIGAADVQADDTTEIYAGDGSGSNESRCVRLSNFGFSTSDIPSGSTINKVSYRIKRRRDGGTTAADILVQMAIHSAGTSADRIGSSVHAQASGIPSATSAGGGSAFTFEFTSSLPTDAQLRASSFAVDYRASKFSAVVYVGIVEVQVEYTAPTLVGRADETDSALSLAAKAISATGRADETDAAITVAALSIAAGGLAQETDNALALSGAIQIAVGLASETDTAFELEIDLGQTVRMAAETDEALGLTPSLLLPVGLAEEADTAFHLAFGFVAAVGMAEEVSAAEALAPLSITALGYAEEADTAMVLSLAIFGSVGMALESDLAFPPHKHAIVMDGHWITFPADRLIDRMITFEANRFTDRTITFD